ncbi:hypothetical protein L484_013078 [Morus notabilis]|uniref:Uncharacterized protein n=1 Tax=Morus notabilis TaxID=981085 RepID=W9R1V6_9ROSA|nr:hypothetical protein L484_013078 [Morus notabilis]
MLCTEQMQEAHGFASCLPGHETSPATFTYSHIWPYLAERERETVRSGPSLSHAQILNRSAAFLIGDGVSSRRRR